MVDSNNLLAVTGLDVKALGQKVDMECRLDYVKSGSFMKLCKVHF